MATAQILAIEKLMIDTVVPSRKKITIVLPIEVQTSKRKKFILNLNNYRNAYYRTLSVAKNKYSDITMSTAQKLKYLIQECHVEIVYYAKTRRRMDLSNACSICDKFATDAFTKLGYWKDDDVSTIPKVTYTFGGYDKDNPRFEYIITVLKSKSNERKNRRQVPKRRLP